MAAGGWSVPGYTELRELGAGGGGRVVLARHDESGVHVAIKYLSESLRDDPGFLARFRDEARLLVELADPNVTRLYEYVEEAGNAAIVMEAVDAVSLRELLREHGATGPEAALVVLKGSLLGLAAAHGSGLVHRDYKPENVLVQADGASKLVDFGIAVRAGQADAPAGTPPYMAPEQWTGAPASPATDVYAATVVFFECLTGRRPYRAGDRAVLMHQHAHAPIPVEEVPGPVRDLVARGMAKDPCDRPVSSAGFVAELEAVATAAYGPDWEERGRSRLAALAALLPLLFRLRAPGSEGGTALFQSTLFRTVLGALRGRSAGVAVGAGLVLAAGGVSVYVLAADRAPEPQRIDVVAAAPPSGAPGSPGPESLSPPPTSGAPTAPGSPSGEPATPPGLTTPPGTGEPSSAGPSSPPAATAPAGGPTTAPTTAPAPGPTATATLNPTPTPTPTPTATPTPTPTLTPTPTPTATPTAAPRPLVRRVDVARAALDARGAAVASVTVGAANTRQVRLRVAFRVGRSVQQTTVALAGATDYTRTVRFSFPKVPCGSGWSVVATGLPSGRSDSASGRTAPCARPTPTAEPTPTRRPTTDRTTPTADRTTPGTTQKQTAKATVKPTVRITVKPTLKAPTTRKPSPKPPAPARTVPPRTKSTAPSTEAGTGPDRIG
ncbi:protein kinase [Planomonospora sp. ID91781]|uniref:serine/threonine-protein kinase n=1 Tax=Planomonospora sp. ID91781 TaxID=2738135 RepID=UPI0018C40C6E|nr:serine/threonine-protein kinase [Planomonospora sp. ID91781]MBG0825098.1 protein kinase [Planomonospora sp. ID91781]